ncbi:AraC family transcriptional regulator [Thalassotalea castellviae]|uniref:GyrI-like domain-containing protein n=1 Tax=Thalassotalea castellviae TaxID=3075612 RepID=A0ABU3A3T1_9GAMM|nr:GyrI-like domain-containing protein [Thalassotalea sp. W431]MDT0604819.1 GyrI-like domain-containing protein [Thalassotalea sp. W431]
MANYQQRFALVLEYIDKNLEDQINIDQLSKMACFSHFHFHRQFSAYIGQPVHQFIQQSRLNKAAFQLVYRQQLTVGEIAEKAAFSNSESFSRAFKQMFNQTPSQYRKKPALQPWLENDHGNLLNTLQNKKAQQRKARENMYNHATSTRNDNSISIVNFPHTTLAVYSHVGSPSKIMASVQHFIAWRKAYHTPPSHSKTYNLVYNDPSHTLDDDFRFDICAQTEKPIDKNEYGVFNLTIPAGRCAKYRHIGSDRFLAKSFDLLYGQWLPQSGEHLRDFPCILERVKMFPDVAESETIIDIYLPLL